jgi:phosphate transport system permease protein/phosphate transport system substrate-binding protein
VTLTGAGATLSYPLLSVVAGKFQSDHPGITINYEPIGSIAGISQFIVRTVDFAATYPPMTQQQRNIAPGIPLHIPEAISVVVVAYNVPGLTDRLKLTGNVTADIFLGKIKMWTDPEITVLNPGQTFPDKPINTWHMSEAEGTTFVFTSYLSSVSPTFRDKLGFGTSVPWTIGVSVPTDAGVASLMQSTPYSVGYMELSYALQTSLSYAALQNSQGNYIVPSSSSAGPAEQQLKRDLPSASQDWSDVNLLNEPGADAYPLVTFTYLLVYQNFSIQSSMDLAKAKALASFLWYLVHDGQSLGAPLGYVPLPANVVAIDETGIKSIVFQGQQLISSYQQFSSNKFPPIFPISSHKTL